MEINQYIDHSLLAPAATLPDIKRLCEEALEHQFYAVCVNSAFVKPAAEILKGSGVKLASTIGFPLGACSSHAKYEESIGAIKDGADELDMVLNLGFLKNGEKERLVKEIATIKEIAGKGVLKVILETCFLSPIEILSASKLSLEAGADFIKTSTGFGSRGASLEDVRLMKEATEGKIKIKASGGIKDLQTAREYIELGVSRIGTSSGIKIMNEKNNLE